MSSPRDPLAVQEDLFEIQISIKQLNIIKAALLKHVSDPNYVNVPDEFWGEEDITKSLLSMLDDLEPFPTCNCLTM